MSVLTGPAIQHLVEHTDQLEVDPFDPDLVNPASYDLRLGDRVAVYDYWVDTLTNLRPDGAGLAPRQMFASHAPSVKDELKVVEFAIRDCGWVLIPGILYLMVTVERVTTKRFEPVVDGKSSIGRLGVSVHQTAGYGEPGFDGQYTLEVTAVHPVRVYAGMRIAQIRFQSLEGEVSLYDGNYVGEAARGPVPSRAWKQFR